MVLETNWMGTGCVRNGEACGWIWRDLAPKPYGLSKALGASNLRHINISSILIGLIHWTSILEPYLGWWSASIFQMDWSHLSGFVSNGIFVLTGKVMINQRNVVPCFQNPIIICYVYIHNIRTKYENMIIYIYIQSTDVLQASVCFSITQTIWSWWVQKERRHQMKPNALFMDESIYRSRGLAGSNMQHVTQKTSQSLIQNINGSLQLPQSCSGSRKDGLRNPLEDNRIPWYCGFSSIMFVFQAAKIMKISRFSPSQQFSDAKSPCEYEVSIQMINKPPQYPKLTILLPLYHHCIPSSPHDVPLCIMHNFWIVGH